MASLNHEPSNEHLRRALETGSLDGVRHALENGASPDVLMRDGSPALCAAARLVDPGPLDELIEAGAFLGARCGRGATALHAALDAAAVERLLFAGLDPNMRDRCGATPLHYPKTLAAARLLVAAGADLHTHGETWHTPGEAMRAAADLARAERDPRRADLLDRTASWLEHQAHEALPHTAGPARRLAGGWWGLRPGRDKHSGG